MGELRVLNGESGCKLTDTARSSESFLCCRWTALVPVQCRCSHMVFTCSITSTLDIFPNTHTCAIGPVIPQTSTPAIDTVTTCAHVGAKNTRALVCLLLAAAACPPPPTARLRQTCVQASGSVSVFSGVISSCPVNAPESQP